MLASCHTYEPNFVPQITRERKSPAPRSQLPRPPAIRLLQFGAVDYWLRHYSMLSSYSRARKTFSQCQQFQQNEGPRRNCYVPWKGEGDGDGEGEEEFKAFLLVQICPYIWCSYHIFPSVPISVQYLQTHSAKPRTETRWLS